MKRLLHVAISMAMVVGATHITKASENSDPLTFTKGNTTAKIGGFVTMTMGSYIEGGTSVGKDFAVYSIDMDQDQQDENRLIMDPTSTRLSLSITQKTETLGDVKLYVETDFRGSGSSLLVLRIATIQMKGFTIGQDWSLMTDSKAVAPTIDLPNSVARTFFRTQMVAYRYKFDKALTLGASAEYPTVNATYANSTSPDIRIPDMIAYLEKSGKLGRIKVTGVWRNMAYSSGDDVKISTGWGAQLSGSISFSSRLTIYSLGIYGHSITKYINDFQTLGYDIIEDSNGDIYDSTPMYGWAVGAKFKLSDKFALTTNFSKAYIDIDTDYSNIANTYKSGRYNSATLFYYPTKSIITGIEYLNGSRSNYDSTQANAQRINMMVRYLF
ncbi:MAG: DcaP family trimeric outer membrane transporter [Rikenellaceae bacterium]